MDTTADDVYEGFDTGAAAAEIGAALFGQSEKTGGAGDIQADTSTPKDPAGNAEGGESTPQTDPAAQNTPADANMAPAGSPSGSVVAGENSVAKPLPKSWKKDLAPAWEKLDPVVRDYVHEREAQVMRGINQYHQGYTAWTNLTKPFAPLLEQNPDINPISLMQGLMATHLQFLNPQYPMEKKRELAIKLLSEYGVTLDPAAAQPDAALMARVTAAERAAREVQTNWQRQEQIRQQEALAQQTKSVDAFAADPKNKYFDEVSNDILRFIQTGVAADLSAAYEMACWANPAVRAKILADQQAESAKPNQPRDGKTGKFVNIEEDANAKPKKPKVGTMDDTINAVVAKHFTKH